MIDIRDLYDKLDFWGKIRGRRTCKGDFSSDNEITLLTKECTEGALLHRIVLEISIVHL